MSYAKHACPGYVHRQFLLSVKRYSSDYPTCLHIVRNQSRVDSHGRSGYAVYYSYMCLLFSAHSNEAQR